jgi:hypothetical protein
VIAPIPDGTSIAAQFAHGALGVGVFQLMGMEGGAPDRQRMTFA